jgi:hypothetical protein
VFIVQAYQTSQQVVLHGGISFGKWRSSFAGSSDSKTNVQSACALNTSYVGSCRLTNFCFQPRFCTQWNGMQLYKSEAHVQDFERGLIFKIGQM